MYFRLWIKSVRSDFLTLIFFSKCVYPTGLNFQFLVTLDDPTYFNGNITSKISESVLLVFCTHHIICFSELKNEVQQNCNN